MGREHRAEIAEAYIEVCDELQKTLEELDKALRHTQPDPIPNTSKPVWELVIEDMHARDRLGRERYGTPLQANNGRDALRDAYEEALDLCVYLRQAIEERDFKSKGA